MRDEEQKLRVFCAVDLPDALKARAVEHIAALRERFPRVRVSWDRAEKFHITLKFLGEVAAPRVEDLARAAGIAASRVEPFRLLLGGPGTFPPKGAPRVLWLGIGDPSGRLASLQRSLEDECAAERFPREARPFHPHLTVGRVREQAGARALGEAHRAAAFEAEEFEVTELLVVRSELGPGGSRYTVLSRHRLEGQK